MNTTTLRPLSPDDLDAAIDLWRVATADGAPPVFGVADAVQAIHNGSPAVGAFASAPAAPEGVAAGAAQMLLGTAVVKVEGDRAWLLRWVVHPEARRQGIGSRLLDEVLRQVRDTTARRVTALLPREEVGHEAFTARGFGVREQLRAFELPLHHDAGSASRGHQLGAQHIDPGAWGALAGMAEVKSVIERRVVLPLAKPSSAADHGVAPPRAIMLFGPPGTGKTTFAKAVAGRLGWPFVELRPSALGSSGGGRAAALREFFHDVEGLDEAVMFIDEVEEIAATRGGDPDQHALTNELLKLIPAFREGDRRLLVCATNAIGSLDQALRRPGRFDYLLPVGPPDAEARNAIWSAYLSGSKGSESVDVDALVGASEGATPADIEFACRKAAQRSFERAVIDDDHSGLTTTDVELAWQQVGPSLTRDDLRAFEDDIADHRRD